MIQSSFIKLIQGIVTSWKHLCNTYIAGSVMLATLAIMLVLGVPVLHSDLGYRVQMSHSKPLIRRCWRTRLGSTVLSPFASKLLSWITPDEERVLTSHLAANELVDEGVKLRTNLSFFRRDHQTRGRTSGPSVCRYSLPKAFCVR